MAAGAGAHGSGVQLHPLAQGLWDRERQVGQGSPLGISGRPSTGPSSEVLKGPDRKPWREEAK